MGKTAFLFPGQGAQFVGMGKDFHSNFPEARQVYEKASEVLGLNLAEMCFRGQERDLESTLYSQPTILVTSIAILEVFKTTKGANSVYATAGLSLGEYTAMVFAGALDLKEAVRLVYKRGMFMQEACNTNPGGMVSILGLEDSVVEKICRETSELGIVCAANYNCPGQVVISGEVNALEKASSVAKEHGARKIIPLKVSGGFHSALMKSAGDRLAQELMKTRFSAVTVPIITNVDAKYVRNPEDIRDSLKRQLTSPVRWSQSMKRLIDDGVEEFYEFGPGRVLGGLMRKIDPTKVVRSIDTVSALEAPVG